MMRDLVSRISSTSRRRASNSAQETKREPSEENMPKADVTYVDLEIQFIGASGLPKMDVVGSADPYFIADLNSRISIV
jgi:hypothetical protein